MGLSEAANNAIGALSGTPNCHWQCPLSMFRCIVAKAPTITVTIVGWMSIVGAILAACLVPQLVRMARTRSAKDLSYLFLIFYNIGLVLMAVYLIYSDATVGWITIIIELALGLSTLAGKFYLDTKFPSDRRLYATDAKPKPITDVVNLKYHSPLSSHFLITCDMGQPASLQNTEDTRQRTEASNLEQRRDIVEALKHALLEAGMVNVIAMNSPDSCDNDSTKITILVVEDGYVCISW
jgi:uncharacterized protein with PQ loop repeat